MRSVGILTICLTVGACQVQEAVPKTPPFAPSADAIIYRDRDNSSEWIFDRGGMFIQMTKEARSQLTPADGLRGDFIWDVDTAQCSDAAFSCLEAERFTFVAPKGARRLGDHYVRNGVRFTVESCEGPNCSTARIRVDCDAFVDNRCVSASDDSPLGTNPAMTTYLVHEQDRGMISVGVAFDQPLDAAGSDVAAEYRLVGPRGILAPSIVSPKSFHSPEQGRAASGTGT